MDASGTPEAVALQLLRVIVAAEGKELGKTTGYGGPDDPKHLLDLYAECLDAVNGQRQSPPIYAAAGRAEANGT